MMFLRPFFQAGLALAFFPAGLAAASMFVDFGYAAAERQTPRQPDGTHWNNVSDLDGSLSRLVDEAGRRTGIGLAIVDAFNAKNPWGPTAFSGDEGPGAPDASLGRLGVPTAVQDGFNLVKGKKETAVVELRGLDSGQTYTITVFGSRGRTSHRCGLLIAAGGQEQVLDTANNTGRTAVLAGLRPGKDGVLRIRFGLAGGTYGFLNAMQIDVSPP